ncbi:MAG: hypothetical protein HN348_25110, partial [Proteobacteria bacterium]|nr:hypothetical protein [Pseudomonadota bacterium]
MIDPSLPAVSITSLEIEYRAESRVVCLPPYTPSTFRGTLGNALRQISCTTGNEECSGCPRLSQCPYGLVWDSGAFVGQRRFRDPPRPYVVVGACGKKPRRYQPGETFSFRLSLFGMARAFVPQIVLAARRAGKFGFGADRAEAELVRVERLDLCESPMLLFSADMGMADSSGMDGWVVAPVPIGRRPAMV